MKQNSSQVLELTPNKREKTNKKHQTSPKTQALYSQSLILILTILNSSTSKIIYSQLKQKNFKISW